MQRMLLAAIVGRLGTGNLEYDLETPAKFKLPRLNADTER